ncbi:MAG: hypothetical protein U0105_03235 [Candidatus Obscuribacterales bacterium]
MNELPSRQLEYDASASFIAEFNRRFPTNFHCVIELRRRATGEQDLVCQCGSGNIKIKDDRKAECLECGEQFWLLADTFFHGIRRPRAYLLLIEMFAEGVFINTSQFQKEAQVAYSTALGIFKKLTMVIAGSMTDGAEVPSHLFSPGFCKRSKVTPAGEHPRNEERVATPHLNPNLSVRQVDFLIPNPVTDESDLSDADLEVLNVLTTDPIQFDALFERTEMSVSTLLSSLTVLELSGFVLRLSADRYALRPEVRTNPDDDTVDSDRLPVRHAILETVATILNWIKTSFHGISRKYLQNYLAAYWCLRDRATWNPGALARACIDADAISDQVILAYVSPPLVRMI